MLTQSYRMDIPIYTTSVWNKVTTCIATLSLRTLLRLWVARVFVRMERADGNDIARDGWSR